MLHGTIFNDIKCNNVAQKIDACNMVFASDF